MLSHIYRFRSVENLLGRYEELKNQEIYFARPSELNDPMEGFRDIFWSGDEVLWANLFKHFLLCLDTAWTLFAICGEEQSFDMDTIPVMQLGGAGLTPQQTARHNELVADFLSEPLVQSYVTQLAKRTTPILRQELISHLQALYPLAHLKIQKSFYRHKLGPVPAAPPEITSELAKADTLSDMLQRVLIIEATEANSEELIDAIFQSQQAVTRELAFITQYNAVDPATNKNRIFVLFEFCDAYVQSLERLAYPEWYTACFMSSCSNSSVWGSYGVNHTGVCLKFKVKDCGGHPALSLNGISGWSSSGPIHSNVDRVFTAIEYGDKPVPIDFFRSLGRLPMSLLKSFWYTDDTGKTSPAGEAIFNSEEEWRTKYWEGFIHALVRKSKDWAYEKEYRLLLHSSIFDLSDPASRKLKYDFKDLDGIIFGINTPLKAKIDIAKIIEEKCKKASRSDFFFLPGLLFSSKWLDRARQNGFGEIQSIAPNVSRRSSCFIRNVRNSHDVRW